MENEIIRVKVLGLGAALAAGYVPDQGYFKNPKTGASISQATFACKAGQVCKALKTGAEMYPVMIDGVIYHKGLISVELQKAKFKTAHGASKELVRFEDGSLGIDHLNGAVDVLSVETIAAVHKDGDEDSNDGE